MTRLFIIFLCYYSLAAQAQTLHEHILDKNEPSMGRSDQQAYESSVRGMTRVRVRHFFDFRFSPPVIKKYKNKKWMAKKLKYAVYQKSSNTRWVLYVPGIFTYLESPFASFIAQLFSQMNYNLILVPNTLTSTFIRAEPGFFPGDITKEASLFCDFLADLKSQKILTDKIELFGMSYGGLLASAMAHQCSHQIKRLTIVSPPLALNKSLERILPKVVELSRNEPEIHSSSHSWLFLKAWVGWVPFSHLFYRFFSEGLYFSLFSYKKMVGGDQNSLSSLSYGTKEYFSWVQQQDLQKFYLQKWEPLKEQNPKAFRLESWLKKLEDKKMDYLLVSSHDDPINDPSDVEAIKKVLPNHPIYFTATGGHMGFTSTSWFEKLMKLRFDEPEN